MKQLTFFVVAIIILSASAQGQEKSIITPKKLKKVLTLVIDRQGGANAAGVVWHPDQKKYYAAQAGNADFPMLVFDAKGKKITATDLMTGVDVRGFWYNPATKTLQVTTYDNMGWYEYGLDERGIPENKRKLGIETSQPDPQSVGAFDAKKKEVYFYDYNTVSLEKHGLNGSVSLDKTKLYLGLAAKEKNMDEEQADTKVNYSENAIVYTGNAHAEIGLLNAANKQIELYDVKTGLMTQILKLPEDAPVSTTLDFSYSNNIYWLFNTTAREWYGYK